MYSGGLRLNGEIKSNNHRDLVTIITVVYNGEQHIEQTIQSVINQNYHNLEYIIIDGGSTDGTIDIIKKYEDEIDFWLSEPDKGISDAFNKGIKLANGELIGLVNADDFLDANIIKAMIDAHDVNTPKVLCAGMRIVNDMRPVRLWISNPDGLDLEMTIAHPACFVPKTIYESFGVYDINYKVAMDYDLFLRYRASGVQFKVLNKVITTMRSGGASSANYWRVLFELDSAKRENLKNYSMLKSYSYTILRFTQVLSLRILDKVGMGKLVSRFFKRKSFS